MRQWRSRTGASGLSGLDVATARAHTGSREASHILASGTATRGSRLIDVTTVVRGGKDGYARTLWRDRRTLAVLLGQAPVIAVLIGPLYPIGGLRLPDHHPDQSSNFIFLLVTAALWLGLIDSCREIVK